LYESVDPLAGAEKTIRSLARLAIAEMFWPRRPPIKPLSIPISNVISTTTLVISANRPRAKRRSRHATNMHAAFPK
jgi:hypothetical protein